MMSRFFGLLLASALATGSLDPAWQFRLPERILAHVVAANAGCVAALTRSHLVVLSNVGAPLWEADLSTSVAEPLSDAAFALAPSCDWVAFSLGPGSAAVQIVRERGVSATVPLDPGGDLLPDGHHMVRSVAMHPAGTMIAVGSERGRLWLISSEGRILRTFIANDHGRQVDVAFSATGEQVVVTGWYVVGILDLDGTWRWRREIDVGTLLHNGDLRGFAGLFVPAHGPQGGHVSLLDERGRSVWSRTLWGPSAAISADGTFVAMAGALMTGPQEVESNHVWLVASSGKNLADRDTEGRVDAVSDALQCVVMRERHPSGDGSDVFGFDHSLVERWRVSGGTATRVAVFAGALLVQSRDAVLIAYNLPRCQ